MERITKDYVEDMGIFEYKVIIKLVIGMKKKSYKCSLQICNIFIFHYIYFQGNQEEGNNDLTTYNDEPEINETGNQPEENSPAFNNHAHEIVNRHENVRELF